MWGGDGTKKTLTCGCRGTKVVIHLHEGETKELVHECQGGQIINTCVWGEGTKELIHVCVRGPTPHTCIY